MQDSQKKQSDSSLAVSRTEVEKDQIVNMLRKERTFRLVYQKDYTKFLLEDLHNRLYGKIPRNWVLNITGLIGTPTGIFKSSMGLQIALKLDPAFNLKDRVAFTINQLLDKVKQASELELCDVHYQEFKSHTDASFDEVSSDEGGMLCRVCNQPATNIVLLRKMIFFLDELTHTLKIGDVIRLKNIIDSCRERQLCFICCGVPNYDISFSTYTIERIEESDDKYLPKKRVRYAVRDTDKAYYYGYFMWDLIPLSNPEWKQFWSEYSEMKTLHQRRAIAQQVGAFGMENYAEQVKKHPDFEKCVYTTKKGDVKLHKGKLKNLIFKLYPDFTQQQREMVLAEVE